MPVLKWPGGEDDEDAGEVVLEEGCDRVVFGLGVGCVVLALAALVFGPLSKQVLAGILLALLLFAGGAAMLIHEWKAFSRQRLVTLSADAILMSEGGAPRGRIPYANLARVMTTKQSNNVMLVLARPEDSQTRWPERTGRGGPNDVHIILRVTDAEAFADALQSRRK